MPKGPCVHCSHAHARHARGPCEALINGESCGCVNYKLKQYPPPAGKSDFGNIRMPTRLKERIERIAEREGRSRNQVTVRLLEKALGIGKRMREDGVDV